MRLHSGGTDCSQNVKSVFVRDCVTLCGGQNVLEFSCKLTKNKQMFSFWKCISLEMSAGRHQWSQLNVSCFHLIKIQISLSLTLHVIYPTDLSRYYHSTPKINQRFCSKAYNSNIKYCQSPVCQSKSILPVPILCSCSIGELTCWHPLGLMCRKIIYVHKCFHGIMQESPQYNRPHCAKTTLRLKNCNKS